MTEHLDSIDEKKPTSNIQNLPKFYVEYCMRVSSTIGVIFGWLVDPVKQIVKIHLSSSLETTILPPDSFVWYKRTDIANHFRPAITNMVINDADEFGFISLVPLQKQSSYAFEVVDDNDRREVQLIDFLPVENSISQFSQIWPYINSVFLDLVVRRAEIWPSKLLGDKAVEVHELTRFLRWAVDYVFVLEGYGVFFNGWIVDPFTQIKALVLVDELTGEFEDISKILIRVPRHDLQPLADPFGLSVEELGFIAFLQNKVLASVASCTLVGVLNDGTLIQHKLQCHRFVPNIDNIKLMLSMFPDYHLEIAEIMSEHVGPFLKEAWRGRKSAEPKLQAEVFGSLPEKPRVSLIIPIYGRYDFIHYQLALFANDFDIKTNVDIIYVIDDPRIYEAARRKCKSLYPVFEVPFRVVYGGANFGYARANNLGVGFARGDIVVLLNSDVMPKKAGWVKSLADIYDALEKPGAIAPKLLFEDGSIQHAGMSFIKDASLWANLWINDHPLKGQPNWPSEDLQPRKIHAVTGACLMTKKSLYLQAGGLDESYILGDFEDSDFCLKLGEHGYNNYYIPAIELYHLERQSQSLVESHNGWKVKLSMFNCWQHHVKWNNTLSTLAM